MKIKHIAIITALALMLGGFAGCKLALPETRDDNAHMIGVLLTTEALELADYDALMQNGEAPSSEPVQKYGQRLYAQKLQPGDTDPETGEPVDYEGFYFPGLECQRLFVVSHGEGERAYRAVECSLGLCNIKKGFTQHEDKSGVTLEATLYVGPNSSYELVYLNPVYQTEDGRVFAVQGNAFANSGAGSSSMAISEDVTEEVDGKSHAVSFMATVNFEHMETPTGTAILFMGDAGKLVAGTRYPTGGLPDNIKLPDGTRYIIAETYGSAGTVTRELYQAGDDYLTSYRALPNGLIAAASHYIEW